MNIAAHKLDKSAGLIRVTVPFEVKHFSDHEDPEFFHFEGFGSTFGNIDDTGDRIEFGAFTETLKRRKPSLLFGHDMNTPVGVFADIEERSDGLFVKGLMPKADTFVSGRIIPQMKIGSIKALSIGFFIIQAEMIDNIRVITEVELLEISLVTIPANQMARITEMRALGTSRSRFADLTIDFDRSWDGEAAAKRLEDMGHPEGFPERAFTDVVDGERVAVWAGVLKFSAFLLSTDLNLPGNRDHVMIAEHYYAKAGRESPFRTERGTIGVEELGAMTLRQLEGCLQGGVAFSQKASMAFSARLRDADRDGQRDAEDLVAKIRETTQQIREMKS